MLKQKPFLIKVTQWEVNDGGTVKTSILSKTLDAKKLDARSLNLKALRALISGMSSRSSVHKFCTASGTTIEDDTISFEDYLNLDPGESVGKSAQGVHTINVFFKAASASNNPPADAPALPNTQSSGTDGNQLGSSASGAPSVASGAGTASSTSAPLIDGVTVSGGAGTQPGAGALTEEQWNTVLRNCNVFYGWCIDRATNQITRAIRPAFQLRSASRNIDLESLPEKPKAAEKDTPKSEMSKSKPKPPAEQDKARVTKARGDIDPETLIKRAIQKARQAEQGPRTSKGQGNTSDTDDTDTETDSSADEAENTRGKAKANKSASIVGTDTSKSEGKATEEKSRDDQKAGSKSDGNKNSGDPDDDAKRRKATSSSDDSTNFETQSLTHSESILPNFNVNDDSRVEVTACSHDFEVSMARSDFSSKSVEGTM